MRRIHKPFLAYCVAALALTMIGCGSPATSTPEQPPVEPEEVPPESGSETGDNSEGSLRRTEHHDRVMFTVMVETPNHRAFAGSATPQIQTTSGTTGTRKRATGDISDRTKLA